MTTKELIEKLQELDPDGNLQIWCGVSEVDGAVKSEGKDWYTGEPTYWIDLK